MQNKVNTFNPVWIKNWDSNYTQKKEGKTSQMPSGQQRRCYKMNAIGDDVALGLLDFVE